jgi:hypothetical protein
MNDLDDIELITAELNALLDALRREELLETVFVRYKGKKRKLTGYTARQIIRIIQEDDDLVKELERKKPGSNELPGSEQMNSAFSENTEDNV